MHLLSCPGLVKARYTVSVKTRGRHYRERSLQLRHTQPPHKHFFLVDLGSSGKEEHQDGGRERETSSNRFTGKGKGDVILAFWALICQVGDTSVGEILNMMKKARKKAGPNELDCHELHAGSLIDANYAMTVLAYLSSKSKIHCK